MSKFLAAVVGVLGIMLIAVLIGLLFIKIGWSLFMVPVFGLREITWMEALGFSLLASCFRSSGVRKSE